MLTLPPPKSQLAEVLYGLITENEISEQDYSRSMNGFRSRLTEIRRLGLDVRFKWKEFTSKFKHKGVYKTHYLWLSQKKKAEKLYLEINKK